ncbi:MAG: heme biosynthesis HemY N-terminal domain-containing protein [Candidatus Arsenophonus melophagi]|nr:heme biosynthesis HemY N-terminal domain-containing protein [Candidatus Arsenophonus melophagi]
MIKVLFFCILILCCSIIGPVFVRQEGYVLIQTNNYDIETSITGLVICFIILQFIFYFLGCCYRRIRSTTLFTHHWLKSRSLHREHSQMQSPMQKKHY